MADGITWGVVELGAGIISCCLPTLMPIVQAVSNFVSRQVQRHKGIFPHFANSDISIRRQGKQQLSEGNRYNEPTAMDFLEMLDGPPYSEWRIQPGSIDGDNPNGRLDSYQDDNKRGTGASKAQLNGSSIRVKEVKIQTRSGFEAK